MRFSSISTSLAIVIAGVIIGAVGLDAWLLTRPDPAIAEAAGGILGFIISNDKAEIPAEGQRVKVSGLIVVHEPDPENAEPRYFTLEAETYPQDITPTTVNLDFESLNRYERQFIINRCGLSVTTCRATVLGKIGAIVS
jgi:hypothetical protein